jgi:hypothetical protein
MPPFRTNSQNTYNKNPFSSIKTNTEDVKLDPILNMGIALVVVSSVLATFLYYINNKYQRDLDQKKKIIESKTLEIKNISLTDMSSMYNKYKIIVDKEQSRALLNNIFEYLSYVVIPGVYFNNFEFAVIDSTSGIVSLNATALDLRKTILQMDSFRNSPYNKFILKEDVKMESFKDENGKFQILVKMKVKTNVKEMEFIQNDYIEEDKMDYSVFFRNKNTPSTNTQNIRPSTTTTSTTSTTSAILEAVPSLNPDLVDRSIVSTNTQSKASSTSAFSTSTKAQ